METEGKVFQEKQETKDSLNEENDRLNVKNDIIVVNNDGLVVKNDSLQIIEVQSDSLVVKNDDLDVINESSDVKTEGPSLRNDTSTVKNDKTLSKPDETDGVVVDVDIAVVKIPEVTTIGVPKKKRIKFIDSDSEEELVRVEEADPRFLSDDDNHDKNDGDLPQNEVVMKSRLATICDSDSSEEEEENDINPEVSNNGSNDESNDESKPEERVKKKTKTKETLLEKPKKMTGKEALEQRRVIESESQRMKRERQVCLPYHKPKQRTLREFLEKRPKFASAALPINAPPSVAIKMSTQHLEIISKRLEEREKEVEKFFKSDSEVSDDGEETVEDGEARVVGEEGEKVDEPREVVAVERGEDKLEDSEEKIVEEAAEVAEEGQVTEAIGEPQMDYEFNLDDSHEEPEPQNFQATVDGEPQTSRRLQLLESLKDKLATAMPKLSGGPNLLIDLENGVTKPDEVTELMQRFAQHTSKKSPHKQRTKVSVVSVDGGGEIHKEQLAVKLTDPDAPPINEKPGAMLKKLRSELETQMALRRTELWRQKQKAVKPTDDDEETSDMYEGERETCGGDEEDVLDDEAEEDFEESEEDEEEIEEKEEKNKSEFVDDEVEEDEENEEEEESEDEDNCQTNVKVKQLKRIIKPCEDDSDEEETKDVSNDQNEIDSCDEDDCPPAGQSKNDRTPKRLLETSKSELNFLTPVCHLTGLQARVDDTFLQETSSPRPGIVLPPDEPSPLKGNWQKTLFSDDDIQPTQENVDDLSELCSGKFPSQTQKAEVASVSVAVSEKFPDVSLTSPVKLPEVEAPSTQELMDLCSGKFTSSENPEAEVSQSSTVENVVLGQSKEIKNFEDENEDKFISQLLDEQEMEEFKKKFQSPVVQQPSQTSGFPVDSKHSAKISFESSDDERDTLETGSRKKRKKIAIVDSDDESEDEEQEEAIDLHDNVEDDEEVEEDNENVEYDSEENEVELVNDKPEKKKKVKASDFFEEEAELSESEWGSEDEDEGGLDILDTELGDSEKFDEDKVRNEIEKLHMRRILDDDNREVKILQELLLEDGELHGAGRQRQFRWKNIDSETNDTEAAKEEDGENQPVDEDEEDELEWRKKRHEREIFLRKNSQNSQDRIEDDCDLTVLTDSKVIKLGQKAIIRNSSQSVDKPDKPVKIVNVKQPFSLLSKRGSFLSRTDQVLARVAEFTKIQENSRGGAKNSRNFVFQSVEPSEPSTSSNDKKRKAGPSDGTPMALKKIRLNTLSPALQKKTDKNMKKKLFGGGGW